MFVPKIALQQLQSVVALARSRIDASLYTGVYPATGWLFVSIVTAAEEERGRVDESSDNEAGKGTSCAYDKTL